LANNNLEKSLSIPIFSCVHGNIKPRWLNLEALMVSLVAIQHIITLSVMAFSIMTLSIITLGIITFNMITQSIM